MRPSSCVVRIRIADVEPHLVPLPFYLQALRGDPERLAHLPHHLLLGESQTVGQRADTNLLTAELRIVDHVVQHPVRAGEPEVDSLARSGVSMYSQRAD